MTERREALHRMFSVGATSRDGLASRPPAATINRRLVPERRKYQLKGRSHTKPGTRC